jgi:hypothetical protein
MAIQHLIEKASRSPAITAGGVMSHPEKTAIKHQRLLKTLGPGVGPLRKLIPNGYVPEPVKRASRALKLNTDNQIDWQVLAALLAIHLFDDRKRGRQAWSDSQLFELLFAVQQRKEKNPRLSDEQVCRLIAKDKNSPPYFRVGLRGAEGKGQGLIKRLGDARKRFHNSLARASMPLAFGRN